MRYLFTVITLLLSLPGSAAAEVSIRGSIDMPGLHIGIDVPDFPNLVPVPGYPVYYAPEIQANYFFYEDQYWLYQDDNWFSSYWYNGPWNFVEPEYVPQFVLRIPVRYYVQPPVYFRGWRRDAPPRWGEFWGRNWERNRRGWDRWDRRYAPRPAPLPSYQQPFPRDRYPHEEAQRSIRNEHHRNNQPRREREVRQPEQSQGKPAYPRNSPQTQAPSSPREPQAKPRPNPRSN